MHGASTARGIVPVTATSLLALSSARIALTLTERPTRCTSATSSPSLVSVGILSRSEWSRSAATNASSTSSPSTRKSVISSRPSTVRTLRTTTDACWRLGCKESASMKSDPPATGANTSTRRMSSTRYLTRHRQHTSQQVLALPVCGRKLPVRTIKLTQTSNRDDLDITS